jgi:hypothetical protein
MEDAGGMVATLITSLSEFYKFFNLITISSSVACRSLLTAEETISEFSFDTAAEAKKKKYSHPSQ